jgi:hypothetical protein
MADDSDRMVVTVKMGAARQAQKSMAASRA